MKDKPQYLASFARRVARTLSATQKKLLKELLPLIQIGPDCNFSLFKEEYAGVELEIGSGNGEFISKLAKANPDKLYIACEPFINGVASLLKLMHENKITNIRIFMDDARLLLASMPNSYLEHAYIICPDPWPKRKQQKRRLINQDFLKLLYAKLINNLLIVTDHIDYAAWILNNLIACNHFILPSQHLADFTELPKDWLFTKYQKFGIEKGGKIHYFKIKKGG